MARVKQQAQNGHQRSQLPSMAANTAPSGARVSGPATSSQAPERGQALATAPTTSTTTTTTASAAAAKNSATLGNPLVGTDSLLALLEDEEKNFPDLPPISWS